MIVGVSIGMIPDDRNIFACKRPIVASAHRLIPRTIVRVEAEAIAFDIVFQPLSEGRMRLGIEVNHVLWVLGLIVSAYHVEVEVALYLRYERASLHKIFRAQQSYLLTIPKGEDDVAFRLYARQGEGSCYLQHRTHARCVIVGTIIYLVALKVGVGANVVEVSAHDGILCSVAPGYHCQHVSHIQSAVCALLQYSYRVGVHLPRLTFLPFHAISAEGLFIVFGHRLYAPLFKQ